MVKAQIASLVGSVPKVPESIIIFESTANMLDISGQFKAYWDASKKGKGRFVPFFAPWTEDDDYQVPGAVITEKTEYERQIQASHGVTDAQLAWRRMIISDDFAGDERYFMQEYPLTEEEAFQSPSGLIFPMLRVATHGLSKAVGELLLNGYDLYRGFDWGDADAFTCLWIAHKAGPPGFSIDIDECPNTWRELTGYAWDDYGRPRDDNDHACFPAGTLVMTTSGNVPIESVRPGQLVMSHSGPTRIVAARKTGVKPLLRLTLSDMRMILCTAEHPLALSSGGFVPAGQSLGKVVDVWLDEWKWSHSMASSSVATRIPAGFQKDGTLFRARPTERGAFRGYIRKSGSNRMDAQFLPDIIYTTETGIGTTTHQRTLNALLVPNTYRNILARIQRSVAGTSNSHNLLRAGGTVLQRVVRGTESRLAGYGRISSHGMLSATIAESRSHFFRNVYGTSVQTTADQQCDAKNGKTSKHDSVVSVMRRSWPTSTRERPSARRRVRSECVGSVNSANTSEQVFALATEAGTYFANGVLVSNCDPLRYAIDYFGMTGHVHIYRELYVEEAAARKLSVLDLAKQVVDLSTGEPIVGSVGDRSRPGTILLLAQQGLYVEPYFAPAKASDRGEKGDGIMRMQALMNATRPLVYPRPPDPWQVCMIEERKKAIVPSGLSSLDLIAALDHWERDNVDETEDPWFGHCN
jgi:hypothetical protein